MKAFVIDTNVLLNDPTAFAQFDEHDVYIPLTVVSELDTFKKGEREISRSARECMRRLDALRPFDKMGVKMENGGRLFIITSPVHTNEHTNDDAIIACARSLKPNYEQVTLVTQDLNMRIKADALGLSAEEYKAGKVGNIDSLYQGVASYEVENIPDEPTLSEFEPLEPNQFLHLLHVDGREAAWRMHGDGVVRKTDPVDTKKGVWGLFPRSMEQQMALDLLLDDNVALVSLIGSAGCGKTLLAMAAALELVDRGRYKKVSVCRPVIPFGRDVGFLPGTIEEKMEPWMRPIKDALDFLVLNGGMHIPSEAKKMKHVEGKPPSPCDELFNQGVVEIEPLTYIRGRSIPNQLIILDEAQNCSRHEMKTILSRVGEGTKIILTGDPYQIDDPYLDSMSNGLSFVAEVFKSQKIAGHITLTKGERSELATIAAEIM